MDVIILVHIVDVHIALSKLNIELFFTSPVLHKIHGKISIYIIKFHEGLLVHSILHTCMLYTQDLHRLPLVYKSFINIRLSDIISVHHHIRVNFRDCLDKELTNQHCKVVCLTTGKRSFSMKGVLTSNFAYLFLIIS